MKSLYTPGAIAFLFALFPLLSSSQQPTTVVNSSNCNFTYTFNTTDEAFSSPSIYSDANDFGLFWNGSNLSETTGANFSTRTASTISGIFFNTESLRSTIGFDYSVPTGTEYRIRIISGQFSPPLEILASTANGPIWSAFPSTTGSLCFELQDADLPVGTQIRYEITFRTINPGAIIFDNFRRASFNIPLPVTFMGFIAREITTGSYKLLWNVAEEVNVRGYEVESSNDGVTFTKIGYIPATGASNYSFMNNQTIKGTQFFRVRNIDIDNQFKYTGIIRIQNSDDISTIKLYPVPATDLLYIEHKKQSAKGTVSVISIDGKVLIQTFTQPGSYQTSVYVNQLPAGIYMIKYDDGKGTVQTTRFIKN
jgi:hypothetical protein